MKIRYRIRNWQFALEVLWMKLRLMRPYWPDLREWRNDIWRTDANSRICCDGYMCGCYGADHYEFWSHMLTNPPKKVS